MLSSFAIIDIELHCFLAKRFSAKVLKQIIAAGDALLLLVLLEFREIP